MTAIAAILTLPLGWSDWVAFAWFFVWWMGYISFASWRARQVPGLVTRLGHYRRGWMEQVAAREVRIGDVSIIANLSNGSTFFASTTLLILGGLLALLGTTEKVASIVSELPFNRASPERLWDIKILLLTGIFMFAFFKFTWSLRLYHFLSVLIGGAPPFDGDKADRDSFVRRGGATASLAAESFNNGLRAYYFALAAMTWFLNPWIWMVSTSWVVGILYHREFHSAALRALDD